MDSGEEKGSEENGGPHSGWQIARWAFALLVALAAIAYYLHGVEAQALCHDTIDSGQVIKLCGPPGLSELVPFALVILVLLVPDFTELAIPGLLSLKRTVLRQESRQDQVETKLAQVEQRVDQRVSFRIDLNTAEKDVKVKEEAFREAAVAEAEDDEEEDSGGAAALPAEPEPPPGPADDGAVATKESEQLTEADESEPKIDAGKTERTVEMEPPGVVSDEDDQRASLTLQLAWLTKNLTQYEAISRMRLVDQGAGERMANLTETQQQSVDRWYTVFEEEIGLVKQFRNALIHNPYAVDLEELREAVRIGRRLMRILLEGIGVSTEALDAYGDP